MTNTEMNDFIKDLGWSLDYVGDFFSSQDLNDLSVGEFYENSLLSIDSLIDQYSNQKVEHGFIFDENQTVVWNHNKVIDVNGHLDAKISQGEAFLKAFQQKFFKHLYTYVSNQLNQPISYSVFEVLYSFSYNEHHSSSFYEVLVHIYELAELYTNCLEADKSAN